MKFVNLCPHDILLNNGTVLKRSGEVARVNVSFGEFDSNGICSQKFGEIQGLGPEIAGVKYVQLSGNGQALRENLRRDESLLTILKSLPMETSGIIAPSSDGYYWVGMLIKGMRP